MCWRDWKEVKTMDTKGLAEFLERVMGCKFASYCLSTGRVDCPACPYRLEAGNDSEEKGETGNE